MKRICLLLLLAGGLLLGPATAGAAAGQSSAQRTLAQAEALFGGASAAAPGDPRGASLVLRDLGTALPELSGAERRRANAILTRPNKKNDRFDNYFGKEAGASPICDAHFCVHWGTAASQAPPPADSQPNGTPDYVESVLDAAATAYTVENGRLGWTDAKSDGTTGARNGKGGAGQVDIYLSHLGRKLFGYATSDPEVSGQKRSGYLVIDNDYRGFNGSPLDLVRVTIAHEYNHILQFAYDSFEDAWMFESTATWVEDRVYPDINDYFNFLDDFTKAPFKPLAETDREAFRLYGSAMWNHWLTAQLGPATIRNAWSSSPSVRPASFAVAAYERAIGQAGGGSFSTQFAQFAAATAELNSGTAFPDAGSYGDMRRSGRLRGKRKLKLDHTAYRLYRVKGGGNKKLKVRAERGTRAGLALVGRIGGSGGAVTVASKFLRRGGRGSVRLPDAGRYDRVTAVVVNADGRLRGNSRDYSRDERKFVAKLKG